MGKRRLMFGLCAAISVACASSSQAAIVITTNMGGADAEVREEQTNVDAETGLVTGGVNRGNNAELATRIKDDVAFTGTTITDPHPASDNSSVMYVKFDISSLPAANDPFWTDKQVSFRGHIRNNNLPESRIFAAPPAPLGDTANRDTYVPMKFKVRGLEPNGVYIDDNVSAANRTDDQGTPYVSSQYRYNWNEGDGTAGSGITYYDAPGMTPHCMDSNTGCTVNESIGKIEDDFNSDARLLGEWEWPNPNPANHLPVGMPVDYTDANLKQLVLDAKAAGRSTVTLIISAGLDGTIDRPTLGRTSTTPESFKQFNYLLTPKENLSMIDDSTYDPDATAGSPNFPADPAGDWLGSPYSCSVNVNRPGCTGVGNNNTGAFSPKLIIFVPEPTSVVLLALGAVAAMWGARRRVM